MGENKDREHGLGERVQTIPIRRSLPGVVIFSRPTLHASPLTHQLSRTSLLTLLFLLILALILLFLLILALSSFDFPPMLFRDTIAADSLTWYQLPSPKQMVLLFMIANTITFSRLILLIIAVLLLYTTSPMAKLIAFFLTILLIIMDGIDGYVARARGETSELGSVMDIAIDRVVENVYWIVYADLDLVPVWVALIVISRGIITDAIRGFVLAKGDTAFDMMKTPWGRWLVSGRFVRGFYGTIKTVVFAGLALFMALRDWFPLAFWLKPLEIFLLVLVYITLATTLLRGFPVLFESRRYFFNDSVNLQEEQTG